MTLSDRELVMCDALGEVLDRVSGDDIAYALFSSRPFAGVDKFELLKTFGVDWDKLAPEVVDAHVAIAAAPSLVGDAGDEREVWLDRVEIFANPAGHLGVVEVEQSDERAPYESAVLGLLRELWPGCNPRIDWC